MENKIILSKEVFNWIYEYLTNRPYKELANVMPVIEEDIKKCNSTFKVVEIPAEDEDSVHEVEEPKDLS